MLSYAIVIQTFKNSKLSYVLQLVKDSVFFCAWCTISVVIGLAALLVDLLKVTIINNYALHCTAY